jgi:demethylmenaquinone methyltransferase/2-methoxy-6-polyprenyl-1,4-benzoquinol methylase
MSADRPVVDGPQAGLDVAQAVAEKKPETIAGMFDQIAGRYDLLNHLLSGGADWYWRWRAVRALRLGAHETVLDSCTGTCDLALEALRRTRVQRVIGVDFAAEMLRIGRAKLQRHRFAERGVLVRGDASRLPMADATVDAAMIAFGIRNIQRPELAAREMARVLRPGGRLAVLEFSMPRLPVLRQAYRWYFRHVLPRIGALVSSHRGAYTYLPTSVGAFFAPEEFSRLLSANGFRDVRAVPLTFGVVQLYLAARA